MTRMDCAHFRAPTLGPLLSSCHVGQPHEQLRVSLGFEAAWGPPQAVAWVTATPGADGMHCTVRHVMPWKGHDMIEGSPCCVQAFDLRPDLWGQEPTLTCLLAYGFDSLPAIQASHLPWPKTLPPACTLMWPSAWQAELADTCFVVGSCQYPAGLLDAAPNARDWSSGPADASFARLMAWRQTRHQPQPLFALLLGDQVYADATAGLFDPQKLSDRYVHPYLAQMKRSFRNEALRHLPVLCLPDDHEIHNDWQPAPHTRIAMARNQAKDAGLAQYWRFQRMQPPQPRIWQQFKRHGASFFLADTRSERSGRTAASIDAARIMSDTQDAALMDWLKQEGPHPHPKFMACPSAVLPRRQKVRTDRPASALLSDAWDGYPGSLHRFLAALADHRVTNLVLLSGDEHISSLARIDIQRLDHPGQAPSSSPHPVIHTHSVHSSGWYSPYPFANSQPQDLRGDDVFEFSVGDEGAHRCHYRCTVRTAFYLGDGCALIQTDRQGRVRCRFLKGQAELEPPDWLTLQP